MYSCILVSVFITVDDGPPVPAAAPRGELVHLHPQLLYHRGRGKGADLAQLPTFLNVGQTFPPSNISCTPASFPQTKLLNDINRSHSDGGFGKEAFTCRDLVWGRKDGVEVEMDVMWWRWRGGFVLMAKTTFVSRWSPRKKWSSSKPSSTFATGTTSSSRPSGPTSPCQEAGAQEVSLFRQMWILQVGLGSSLVETVSIPAKIISPPAKIISSC